MDRLEFFREPHRVKLDIRGHSNRKPTFVSKNAFIESKKYSIRLEIIPKTGVEIWDNRKRKKVDLFSNVSFTFSDDFNELKQTRLRFIAKTALSAGYYVYEDAFIKYANHEELRSIMNFDGNYNNPNH
jgi:hypothetical protein